MSETLIIVPTYDEKENVRPLSETIHKASPASHILFVDDNSPDGTGRLLDEMSKSDARIHVMHRPGKQGLGRAYIAGFKWAVERGYSFVFEMDADFSHDPREVPNFLKAAASADLVIGSRYVGGIRVMNWPMSRLMLSTTAAKYVKIVTGMPFSDPTGGYKCYRREVLTEIPLDTIVSNGYSFQVEMTYNVWIRGFRIVEIPIIFEDRHSGYSKMTTGIAKEALQIVLKLAFRHGFRRHPAVRSSRAPAQ
jgi:dolichol-phosphate mannosyltransferase